MAVSLITSVEAGTGSCIARVRVTTGALPADVKEGLIRSARYDLVATSTFPVMRFANISW